MTNNQEPLIVSASGKPYKLETAAHTGMRMRNIEKEEYDVVPHPEGGFAIRMKPLQEAEKPPAGPPEQDLVIAPPCSLEPNPDEEPTIDEEDEEAQIKVLQGKLAVKKKAKVERKKEEIRRRESEKLLDQANAETNPTAQKELRDRASKIASGEIEAKPVHEGTDEFGNEIYCRVMFHSKTNKNDPENVELSVRHETIVCQRKVPVVLPWRFIECAMHATHPTFKQEPFKDRQTTGEVMHYPFQMLERGVDGSEYFKMKEEGNKIQAAARMAQQTS